MTDEGLTETMRESGPAVLRDSADLTQAVFASLRDHIAVLDEDGVILAANDAWTNWPHSEAACLIGLHAGSNYLDMCRRAARDSNQAAQEALCGIEAVLDGSQPYFILEYPCLGSAPTHWFSMTVMSMSGSSRGVIVAHTDITAKKRAEIALRESEERLRLLLETTNAIPWEANAKTWRFTYVGPQAVKLLGYPVGQWYEDGFWPAHIHPDDREQAIDYCLTSSRTRKNYEFEYRMLAADGRVVWLHDLVSVETVDGEPESLRGFMLDITERKLAESALREGEAEVRRSHEELQHLTGRWLSAQEEERRRLARELHDDLSQRLAALAMEAANLKYELRSLPAAQERIQLMREHLTDMATDVHGISRRLHPAILEELGLVDAVKSECVAFSERVGIPVGFVSDDVPDSVPEDVALCLYRVTQEGLRNVAKHADASEAKISLTGTGDSVVLRICDDGAGFQREPKQGRRGLGLASMEERVRLLQGSLSVQSESGHGTTIRVEAPLVKRPD